MYNLYENYQPKQLNHDDKANIYGTSRYFLGPDDPLRRSCATWKYWHTHNHTLTFRINCKNYVWEDTISSCDKKDCDACDT